MNKTLLILAIAAGLVGCQSNQTLEDVTLMNCTYPDAPEVEAPYWICDVMPQGVEIGGVGYAKKSVAGMSIMRDIATNDARKRLAQNFETNVNNLFQQAAESNIKSTNDSVVEEVVEQFKSVSKNVTSRTLVNSRVLRTQTSPAGGLYTLVGMDKATYDANVSKITATAGDRESELWQKFNNKKAAEELKAALSSLSTQ
ncbi:hypothetical protein BIT28_06370 [Photobacterium proteolyticum]|uniref:LPP20 lipoprotein n=1 Tax=Photobacterium proteolyticum TaxID=1903952 RepID=A0A1Q9GES5_9GAMM|nr:LPP20 family lipoprotein [Photobacterium proteolyticum]OLQ72809.1 hypothetical protein BIT28_06370 [Photobacterium proteolyticum]